MGENEDRPWCVVTLPSGIPVATGYATEAQAEMARRIILWKVRSLDFTYQDKLFADLALEVRHITVAAHT